MCKWYLSKFRETPVGLKALTSLVTHLNNGLELDGMPPTSLLHIIYTAFHEKQKPESIPEEMLLEQHSVSESIISAQLDFLSSKDNC